MKKITVLYGNYGSGKTELSLNIALRAKEEHEDVTLVDFDIVNPYFRSSEHKAMLEKMGIRVIAPNFANTQSDVPSLPPDIYSAFKGGYSIFDCGGDPVGATALGGLKRFFDPVRTDTEALYVVNTRRPFQENAQRIKNGFEDIQRSSRLTADAFILNANLGPETTGEELKEGYEIMKELTELTGLTLKFVSGTKEALEVFSKQCPQYKGETFEIKIYMRPEWM